MFIKPAIVAGLCAASIPIAPRIAAQSAASARGASSPLQAFNESVEKLSARVSSSVVQVLVTGYGPIDEHRRGGESGLVIGRQHSIGSGAIIDPDGYIVTNAHVVAGARRIQVVLHREAKDVGALRSLACESTDTCTLAL